MKIEQEAAAFNQGKRTQFNQALQEYLDPLVLYLDDNLYSTKELSEIKYYLLLVKLLSSHSAETHGMK